MPGLNGNPGVDGDDGSDNIVEIPSTVPGKTVHEKNYDVNIIGGTGGDGGNGGNNGYSGVGDAYDGGPGGIGGDGGNGGNGGNAIVEPEAGFTDLKIQIDRNLNVIGGNGGHGGIDGQPSDILDVSDAGDGGDGGLARLTTHTLSVKGDILIMAGNSGGDNFDGVYGHGGDAIVDVDYLVATQGTVTVRGGGTQTGETDAAVGKMYVAHTATLRDLTVDRTAEDETTGLVDVAIGTLDVDGRTTTLTSLGEGRVIDGIIGGEEYGVRKDFYILNADLKGGGELIINDPGNLFDIPANGTLEIDTLRVGETGYLQTTNRTVQSITTLEVEKNGTLAFMLPGEAYGNDSWIDISQPLVSVGETLIGDGNNNIFPNTHFTVDTRPNSLGRRPHFGPGDEMWLLDSNQAISPDDLARLNKTSLTEAGTLLDIYVLGDNREIWARASVAPMSSLANARLASLGFLNWGSDLLSETGMRSATATNLCDPCNTHGSCETAHRCDKCQRSALVPFVVAQAGSSEYRPCDYSKISGTNMLAGVAWNTNCSDRHLLTIGIFGEGGWGSYDATDRFEPGIRDVFGNGDIEYYGGGLLARYGWNCDPRCGGYIEGSVRAGRAESDYRSNSLMIDESLTTADYKGNYYGAHFGIGYGWAWKRGLLFDLSAKYLWTHFEGEDIDVRFDQTHRMMFDDFESKRTRISARLSHVINPVLMPYIGAGWEYEFDGDANNRYRTAVSGTEFLLEGPSYKGNTGTAEIGLVLRPFLDRNFAIDLGARGYYGVRQGGLASLGLKWEF